MSKAGIDAILIELYERWMNMKLSIIHHIAIIVSDYERSKDFLQIRTDFRSSFANEFRRRDMQILKI